MQENRIVRGNRVLRYNFHERVIHWCAGLSYVYLMLTGLAFWSPWMFWIAVVLGGGLASRMLHPFVGLIFTASVIDMYVMWKKDMKVTDLDRQWTKSIGAYVRNEEEEQLPELGERAWQKWAPVDRFNLGQKYLFWVMFWGGIALLLSGMVLWFTEYIPWSLRFLRYISIMVHPIAFLVTLGGFIIHVYMGTAVVRGGFTSVIRGEVSKTWARHHHRLWLERITGQDAARK
jgi:formate dehydrogenase subunit gamma